MPDQPVVRHVVFHTPGPGWRAGLDFREQPGVQEHVAHYARLHAEGKLAMGGPFLMQDAGGMMIATEEVSSEEITSFAMADPAVDSGLLRAEIRPWYVAMEHSG